jgi:hypothetical protein
LRARGREEKVSLTHSGPSSEFAVQDISVDREGRVTITNPEIGGRLQTAMAVKKPKPMEPNKNCAVCNTVAGCGPLNKDCRPINSVANCGCKKID